MSISKRGRYWHYEIQYKGKRYRGSTECTVKSAALRREKEIREALKVLPSGRTAEDFNLKTVTLGYWDNYAKLLKSAQNVKDELKVLMRYIDFELPLARINSHYIMGCIAQRRGDHTQYGKPPSNATVRREFGLLRQILRYADDVMEVQGLPKIIWKKLLPPKVKPRVREYSDKELAAVLFQLADKYHPLLEFYALYGVRWREAFFDPDNVDVEAGRVFLRERKAGDWHTIPLVGDDRALMATRVGRARRAGLDTVWFYEEYGQLIPITPIAFQDAMKIALKKAGVKARAVHDLRHHAAMQAKRRDGVDVTDVQRLLGHETITSTMVYVHADETNVRNALGESPQKPHTQPMEVAKKAINSND